MVVAVAAESHTSAEEAAALVDVQYEPLPAVFDPVEALTPGAPAVHDAPWSYAGAWRGTEEPVNLMGRAISVSGGDVDAALAVADRVFEHTFRDPDPAPRLPGAALMHSRGGARRHRQSVVV